MTLSERVASRYHQVLADRDKGDRANARKLSQPINTPKGIDRGVVKDNGRVDLSLEESVSQSKTDIHPKDVFPSTPNNVGMLNLAETGKDLSKALETKVPKDKGHDAVSNLSQYLIETKGGGSAKPAGRR